MVILTLTLSSPYMGHLAFEMECMQDPQTPTQAICTPIPTDSVTPDPWGDGPGVFIVTGVDWNNLSVPSLEAAIAVFPEWATASFTS